VPWDARELVGELMVDLRRFDHLASEPRELPPLSRRATGEEPACAVWER
jgi:hypothetical protein